MSFPVPRIRSCSPELLQGLREVDPTSELVYLGQTKNGAKWSLMRLRPKNDYRMAVAGRFYDAVKMHWVEPNTDDERRWYMRLRAARLHLAGYSVISNWEFESDPDQRVLVDYRYRAWRLRHDEAYDDPDQDRLAAVTDAKKAMEDESRARDLARMARCPVTVS
jgi:hypothetical protein